MTSELDELVGREQELETLDRFVAAAAGRPSSLLLQGDAGIGKTTLIERALLEARARCCEILYARPTNAERSLSFLGLTDLLSDSHGLLAELPSPQRRALEAALLLEEPTAGPPDSRAIALGVLGVLRSLAAARPVIVAVDDLQWLDDASVAALISALRRLKTEPVGVLAAIRIDVQSSAADLTRALQGEQVAVSPLSVGAIYALLTDRLGLSVPRALLLRIYEACHGNPLFALEIGRALKERGLPEPGQPFEIPPDAETLFTTRLEQLSDDTLDALAVAASIASPTRSLVKAVSTGALEPAVAADVIGIEAERIRFRHPLLASAAYAQLSVDARRRLHLHIATAVADQEERARHLARAADAPDREVAAALDEAADRASRRGAPAAAAELAQLAVDLTPADDADRLGTRRRIAAELHFLAGDVARSRKILERLVEELPAGTERACALLELAEARSGDQNAMLPLREQAVVEAFADDRVLARALHLFARTLFVAGNPRPSLPRAREAVAAAERTGDVRLLAACLSVAAWLEMWSGRITPGVLERALVLEQEAGYLRAYESPSTVEGIRLMILADDLDAARERLVDAEAVARDHGDDECRALLLAQLAPLECRAGRLDAAERHATESYELRQQFGLGSGAHLYLIALVEALRGRAEEARAAAEHAGALCDQTGNEIFAVRNLWVLGLLALSSGDHSNAARILAPLPERGEVSCLACRRGPRLRGSTRRVRRGRRRPRTAPGPHRAGTDPPRPRSDSTPRRPQACRAREAAGGVGDLRGDRRGALGRTDACRARAVGRPDLVRARTDRRGGARRPPRRRGQDQSRGCRCVVRVRANGRDASLEHLPQAGPSLTHRARRPPRRAHFVAVKMGPIGRPIAEGGLRGAAVCRSQLVHA